MRKLYTSHAHLAKLASERIVLGGPNSRLIDAQRAAALEQRLRDAGTTRTSRPGH
jgi:hypothetical protein